MVDPFKATKPFKAAPSNKSKGILDDTPIRKTISTRQGTITHVPAEENDIVNKAYVDSLIRGNVELFLTEDASDIGTYLDLATDSTGNPEENTVQAITGNSTTLIASYASILNEAEIESITDLEQGIYSMHMHASSSFPIGMTIYFEFYRRTSGGVETLLGTSHDSDVLTATESQEQLHANILEDLMWNTGDRVVVKVYGRNTNAATKNITIFVEGDTLSRVGFPAFIPPAAGGGFTGTEGSIPFVAADGTLTEDNFNLFWDRATHELQPHHMKIVSDGTQASPALKFNDTNTGFYKSGDSVRFSLNNSTIMSMNATGLDMNTHKIVGVVDPTTNQEAATKKYVDAGHHEDKPAFSVYRNAAQNNLSPSSKILFDTKNFDNTIDFDIVTNNRYTPSVAGIYVFTSTIRWGSVANASDVFHMTIKKNGTNEIFTRNIDPTGGGTSQILTVVLEMNGSTDYIEVFGGNVNSASRGDLNPVSRKDITFSGGLL